MNSYKSQSYVLRRDEREVPEVYVKRYALLDDVGRQPQRRSRAPITVAMVLIGLLAGWIGGKFLTGAFQHSKPATAVSIDENAAPASQLHPDSRPSANVIAPGGKSVRLRDQQADSQPPIVDSQSPPETRIDQDKEQEDRTAEFPSGAQSTKEIGQNAMDKILKENDKIKRGKHLKANKNED